MKNGNEPTGTRKVRVGVAGAGKMGQNHIRVLSELSDIYELVGLYDPDPVKAVIAKRYGIRYYDDYTEMLRDVDAVTLPCPTSLHKQMAILAAENDVHALVEKPIAENLTDAAETCEAFINRNLVFTVGHVERFNPVVRAIAELTQDMDIVAIEVHRCSPYDKRIYDVDVVSDLMIHDIDIVVNALEKKEPTYIQAIGKRVHTAKFADYAQATMAFDDGVMASITTSRSTEDKIRTICIHAKGAYIEGDMLNKTLTIKHGTKFDNDFGIPSIKYCQSSITEQVVLPNKEPLKEELRNFGEAILKGTQPEIGVTEVIRTMVVFDKIAEKIYAGKEHGNDCPIL